MRKRLLILIIVIFSIVFAGCGKVVEESKTRLESVNISQNGNGTIVYDGNEHDVILCLPQETKGVPLVVMLPGYGESASAMRSKTAFEEQALPQGYAVIYVSGTSLEWNSGIGDSENDDVGFLCALVDYLCDEYAFDDTRVYGVGFSNGAFMTHRLALEANDTFKGVVCVAGKMPDSIWENRPENCNISVFQITGENDDVVPQKSNGSSQYSSDPAIEDVVDYYAGVNGLSLVDTSVIGSESILEKYSSDGSSLQVWNLHVCDGYHSWPDEKYTGFDVNQVILDFFEATK